MSSNSCFDLLFEKFSQVTEKSLWVLDENPPSSCPPANKNISVISNRFDVVDTMQALGYNSSYSDFDFKALNTTDYQFVFYRISKEKPLTHYIINSVFQLLSKSGQLIISGAKQEGIKGYFDRATTLYRKLDTYKADKQHWAAVFCKTDTSNTSNTSNFLDDKEYTQIRPINDTSSEVVFHSKPGVFGWNKVDLGSNLLIEHLSALFENQKKPNTILDIGCGYGYLSINCSLLFNSFITACDNNAAAVKACKANFKAHSINGEVIATDCTKGISEQYDLIVCNPPFHTGFGVENDLTSRFIKGAKQRLANDGMAVFVVNLHIPLERKAQSYFKHVTKVADNNHFKVIVLKNE